MENHSENPEKNNVFPLSTICCFSFHFLRMVSPFLLFSHNIFLILPKTLRKVFLSAVKLLRIHISHIFCFICRYINVFFTVGDWLLSNVLRSMQGGLEFKSEIEMLSRVHHKNVVSLVGFCFEHDEQMLVYEYIPNGTLKESLSGT